LTQGSQSLALGLTLTAAPQLVECSRLASDGCERIGDGARYPFAVKRIHFLSGAMNSTKSSPLFSGGVAWPPTCKSRQRN